MFNKILLLVAALLCSAAALAGDHRAQRVHYDDVHDFGRWKVAGRQLSGGVAPSSELTRLHDGAYVGVAAYGGRYNCGSIYGVYAGGEVVTLYSFKCALGGSWPKANGPLVEAADGSLWGTTTYGGAELVGSVFRWSAREGFTEVHSFAAFGETGRLPQAGLAPGADGRLWGTTSSGPVGKQAGLVFSVGGNGGVQVMHVFDEVNDPKSGARPAAALTPGPGGVLFGTTTFGGGHDRGTAFAIAPQGELTTLHAFRGGARDGEYPMHALLYASDGLLWGVTSSGGRGGNGVVYRLRPSGGSKVMRYFGGAGSDPADGRSPSGRLAEGAGGVLYGVTVGDGVRYNGSFFDATVFALAPQGAFTTLHRFDRASLFDAPIAGPTVTDDNRLLGTTPAGGENDAGRLYRIVPQRPHGVEATKGFGDRPSGASSVLD
jgi:uncharacterized repeat protein (TIGR03803 family)